MKSDTMKTIIIGGGLTGLSCGYKLQQNGCDYLIIEKEKQLGGLCKSIYKNGFVFDYTGHFLHFKDKKIKTFVKRLLKNNWLVVSRNAKIWTKYAKDNSHLVPFPFQANIGFLKQEVVRECVTELIKAQINLLPITNYQLLNFHFWLIKHFGDGITKYFFLPYNKKLWRYDLRKLSIDWAKRFIPVPNTEEIINNILNLDVKSYGYNVSFVYPKNGGIQSLISAIENKLDKNKIIKNCSVTKIDYQKKIVTLSSGKKMLYNNLISTLPLTDFIKITNLPKKIKLMGRNLKFTGVLCFNIAVKKVGKNFNKVHWTYFPDKEFVFYRVGFYHNINPLSTPKNCGSLYVEVSYNTNNKPSTKNLYHKIIFDLIKAKIISSEKDILFYNVLDIPVAYVVYDLITEDTVKKIHQYLNNKNIYSVGRYGEWKYSYMEENIKDGFEIVENRCLKTLCY